MVENVGMTKRHVNDKSRYVCETRFKRFFIISAEDVGMIYGYDIGGT
jgi:hypothetical protein